MDVYRFAEIFTTASQAMQSERRGSEGVRGDGERE
jgi:hypothetical protein